MSVDTILILVAFILFLIEALRGLVTVNVNIHFGWLGLALWALSLLI